MIDITPFDNFDTFFAWYINIIKSKVPDFLSLESGEIHNRMGVMSDKEFAFTARYIRKIQQIPSRILLMNDNSAGTFYAKWDKNKNCPVIAFPTVMMYWLRYPPIVKGIMQHEIGHCVGEVPDILTDTKKYTDGSLVNISMDVRINNSINYDVLAQIYKCTFTFDNNPFSMKYVPEYWMPNECGLSSSLKTKATWTWLYKSYQEWNPNKSPSDEQQNIDLQEGTYVITTVDKHGVDKNTYGIIGEVIDNIGKKSYIVYSISDEEKEALIKEDYAYFESLGLSRLNLNIRTKLGEYDYNKDLKEFSIKKMPVLIQNLPKLGDTVLMVEDKDDISKGRFGVITQQLGNNEWQINEFSDEVQEAIIKNNYEEFIGALMRGTNAILDNKAEAIFGRHFVIQNLQPPPPDEPTPPTPPKTEKEIKIPQVGDVVVIRSGENAGKYGVIESVIDDKYTISEVSEEIAMKRTGRKI
jgi:hypothetical protein